MASFKFNGMDELTLSLSQLAQTPEDVQYSMLEAGAAVLVEAWKKALEPMKRTGQLIESIKAKRKKGDAPIVAVTPNGTRRSEYRGVRKTKAMGGRKRPTPRSPMFWSTERRAWRRVIGWKRQTKRRATRSSPPRPPSGTII